MKGKRPFWGSFRQFWSDLSAVSNVRISEEGVPRVPAVRVRVRVRVRFLEISNNVSSQGRLLPQSHSLLHWRGRYVLHDGLSQQPQSPEPHTLDPDWGGFPHPTRVGGGGGGEKEVRGRCSGSPLLFSPPAPPGLRGTAECCSPWVWLIPMLRMVNLDGLCDGVDGGLRPCGSLYVYRNVPSVVIRCLSAT